MNKLFLSILLFFTLSAAGQTLQKVTVNGSIIMVIKCPADTSGGKKFPVMIYMGGNGEIGTDTSIIRSNGPFRQMQIHPTQMALYDSMYIVQIIHSSNDAALEQPNNLYAAMDKFDQLHHNSDTTNYMLWGISQGGTNTIESRAYVPSLFSSFGDPTDPRMNRFRVFAEASMCSLRGDNQFNLFAGKIVRFYHGTSDVTCSVGFTNEAYDSIKKYSTNTRKILLTGAGHSNVVWDSMSSPLGADSSTNLYLLLQQKAGTVIPPTDSILAPPVIYDHSNYSSNDYNQADNFFDGYSVWNPVTGVITDTTTLGNPRHGWWTRKGGPLKIQSYFVKDSSFLGVYYRGTRGPDIYMDFSNYADMTDTSYQVTVNKIYAINGEESGHTAKFYRGDAILALPIAQRLQAMARLDSLIQPFDSITTTSTDGELITKTLATPVKTRWVIMRLSQSGSHVSNFRELSFVGNTTRAIDTSKTRKEYTAALPTYQDTSHTFTKVNGMNGFKGVSAVDTKWYGPTRQFIGIGNGYFNPSTVPGVSASYTFWPAITSDINMPYFRLLNNQGSDIIVTIQGAKKYNSDHGYSDVNIDTPRVNDPELTTSWKNSGTFAFNWAAKMGVNAISSGRTRWTSDGSYPNGQAIKIRTGIGNETLDHGLTIRAEFAKKSAEWDGHEGTLGTDIGIRDADTTVWLANDAFSSPDTNAIKVMVQLAQWTRTDKRLPFNWIDYHKYFSNIDSSGNTFSLDEQIGQTGQAFEWAYKKRGLNGITYWQKILRSTYKYTGVMPVYWTEYGIGNDSIPAATEAEAGSIWDIYNITPFGGLNNYQSKATLYARYRLLIPFTGLAGACTYTLENNTNPRDTITSALFASYGEVATSTTTFPFPIQTPYAAYYMNSCIASRLTRYRADGVPTRSGSSDTTGVWKVKYRNVDNTDSVCYAVWYGSKNGTNSSQSVSVGSVSGNVEKMIPSFTSQTGTSSSLTPSAGNVTVTVSEIPTLLFASEGVGSPPSCTTNSTPTDGSTIGTQTTASLTWAPASGADSYQVWVDGVLKTTQGGTTYNAFGFTAGTSHDWYIIPTNDDGPATGCSSNSTSFTTAAAPAYIVITVSRNK